MTVFCMLITNELIICCVSVFVMLFKIQPNYLYHSALVSFCSCHLPVMFLSRTSNKQIDYTHFFWVCIRLSLQNY